MKKITRNITYFFIFMLVAMLATSVLAVPFANDTDFDENIVETTEYEQLAVFATVNMAVNYVVPATGRYKLEAWGASGGDYNSYYGNKTGGKGGYVAGVFEMNAGTILDIYVGGRGDNGQNNSSKGGFNGGGNCSYYGAGGGGASDVRVGSSLYARILSAGGGGGGCYGQNGGHAGGLIGASEGAYGYYAGQEGVYNRNQQLISGVSISNFGKGSSNERDGAGGGSGWFGGYTYSYYYATGGGSSYVNSASSTKIENYEHANDYFATDIANIAGGANVPAVPNGTITGNGCVRISKVNEAPESAKFSKTIYRTGETKIDVGEIAVDDDGILNFVDNTLYLDKACARPAVSNDFTYRFEGNSLYFSPKEIQNYTFYVKVKDKFASNLSVVPIQLTVKNSLPTYSSSVVGGVYTVPNAVDFGATLTISSADLALDNDVTDVVKFVGTNLDNPYFKITYSSDFNNVYFLPIKKSMSKVSYSLVVGDYSGDKLTPNSSLKVDIKIESSNTAPFFIKDSRVEGASSAVTPVCQLFSGVQKVVSANDLAVDIDSDSLIIKSVSLPTNEWNLATDTSGNYFTSSAIIPTTFDTRLFSSASSSTPAYVKYSITTSGELILTANSFTASRYSASRNTPNGNLGDFYILATIGEVGSDKIITVPLAIDTVNTAPTSLDKTIELQVGGSAIISPMGIGSLGAERIEAIASDVDINSVDVAYPDYMSFGDIALPNAQNFASLAPVTLLGTSEHTSVYSAYKITANRATTEPVFMEFEVKDSQNVKTKVRIAIIVVDTAPLLRESGADTIADKGHNGRIEAGNPVYDLNLENKTISFTPYDIFRDGDTVGGIITNGENANSGDIAKLESLLNSPQNILTTFDTTNNTTKQIFNDRLKFTSCEITQGLDCGSAKLNDTVSIYTNFVDITVSQRTSAPIIVSLVVADSFGKTATCYLRINVLNILPTVKPSLAPFTLKAEAVVDILPSDLLVDSDDALLSNVRFVSSVPPVLGEFSGGIFVEKSSFNANLSVKYSVNNEFIDVMRLTGLRYTASEIVIKFCATDNYIDGVYASDLYIKVKMENTAPTISDAFVKNITDSKYEWENIQTPDSGVFYIASQQYYDSLSSGADKSKVKVLAKDIDGDKISLVANGIGVTTTGGDTITAVESSGENGHYEILGADNWYIKLTMKKVLTGWAVFDITIKDIHGLMSTVKFSFHYKSAGIINNHTYYASNDNKYPSSSFKFAPVELDSQSAVFTYVPISYFAMPLVLTNAPQNDIRVGYEKNSALENYTIKAGNTMYSGNTVNDNPYFTLVEEQAFNDTNDPSLGKYINRSRAHFVANERYEDKTGIKLTVKNQRYNSPVELYVSLIDYKYNTTSLSWEKGIDKLTVKIDIVVPNQTWYFSNSVVNNSSEVDVNMTVGDKSQRVALLRNNNTDVSTVLFDDRDKDDNLLFAYQSVNNTFSAEQRAQYFTGSNVRFLNDGNNNATYSKYFANPSDLTINPNLGYSKYFDIELTSDAQTLTIIPKQKTIGAGLSTDSNGSYFPLKLLVYDDYNASGYATAWFRPIILKIYILNHAPTPQNKKVTINAVVGETVSLLVANLFKDYDMSVDASGRYKYYSELTGLDSNRDYVANFAVNRIENNTPIVGDPSNEFINFSNYTYTDDRTVKERNQNVVFTVQKRNSSKTTSQIGMLNRFSYKVNLVDNVGGSGEVTIEVNIINSAPTAKSITQKITMRTGDTFNVYASSHSDFYKGKGISNTVDEYFAAATNKLAFDSNTDFLNFTFDTSGVTSGSMSLGNLALASDDFAWGLRISNTYTGEKLAVEGKNFVTKEKDSGAKAFMAYTITALAPVSEIILPIVVNDQDGKSVTVNLTIMVVSSAPTQNKEKTDFAVTGIGDSNALNIKLNTIVSDIDKETVFKVALIPGNSNSYFMIGENIASSSEYFSVSFDNLSSSIKIVGLKYSNIKLIEQLKFYVMDSYDVVSKAPLVINIEVLPSPISTKNGHTTFYATLKSSEAQQNLSEQEMNLSAYVVDNDFSTTLLNYDVVVKNKDGVKLAEVVGGVFNNVFDGGSLAKEEQEKYFTLRIDNYGKKLLFISKQRVENFVLNISVTKPVKSEFVGSVAFLLNISVENSATKSNNKEFLFDNAFVGSKMTFDLLSVDGDTLFHDYDALDRIRVRLLSVKDPQYTDIVSGKVVGESVEITVNKKILNEKNVNAVDFNVDILDNTGKQIIKVITVNVTNSQPVFKDYVGDRYSFVDGQLSIATTKDNQQITIKLADIVDDDDFAIEKFVIYRKNGDAEEEIFNTSGFTSADGVKISTSIDKAFSISLTSYDIGSKAPIQLVIYDKAKAKTAPLTVLVEAQNIAPSLKSDIVDIRLIGIESVAEGNIKTFSASSIFEDKNGGNILIEDIYIIPLGSSSGQEEENLFSAQISSDKKSFDLTLSPQKYGMQIVTIKVIDDAVDALVSITTLEIYVVKNPQNIILNEFGVHFMRERIVTIDAIVPEIDINNVAGYKIKAIMQDSGGVSFGIENDGGLNWRIKSNVKDARQEMTIVFDVAGKEISKTLVVKSLENKQPRLLINKKECNEISEDKKISFDLSEILADEENDTLTIKKISSNKDGIVTAKYAGSTITLQFSAGGSAIITIDVIDATNTIYAYAFAVSNSTLEPLNFFANILMEIKSNPIIIAYIIAGVVALAGILTLLIILIKRNVKLSKMFKSRMFGVYIEDGENAPRISANNFMKLPNLVEIVPLDHRLERGETTDDKIVEVTSFEEINK